jgi:glycosyltransferase involved in cell wall biosynthesis
MAKVSIIIPSRAESYENLSRTIKSIYENATGEFEVLVGFDGPPYQDFDFPVKSIRFPDVVGIKTNLNALCAMATGKYIYKSDAHCSFGKGFDEILQADMQDDWIVMPRFKIITPDWQIQMKNGQEEFYDYFYICCPFTDPRGLRFKAGGHWPEWTAEKLDILIDETPQIHGSGWFISKDHYFELGGFPNIDPYGHAQEPIWLALKNWLGGGKVMVNKKTFYAHLHQQGNKRGYHMDQAQENKSYDLAARYWLGDKWAERKHDFYWFVDKFNPMPTWPDDWKERLGRWQSENA